MKADLVIAYNSNVKYIEEDRNDIKIVYKHTSNYKLNYEYDDINYLLLSISSTESNFLKSLRESIKDINNKKIINYSKYQIYIYTSKDNIEKLNTNKINYQKQLENDLYNQLYTENFEYQNRIAVLEEELNEKDEKIADLEFQLDNNQISE
jgi:hypothetical protein